MLKFNKFMEEVEYAELAEELLYEKLIVYNGGKKYGQIVFLAGGAASGKGFARENFMEGEKFKLRDVDEWKMAFQKIDEIKGKYPEIRDLDLKNPKHVFKLHEFVSNLGVKNKTLDLLLKDVKQDRLPNILFDVTMKSIKDVEQYLPMLNAIGYNPKDIHITWVLANYHVAVKANQERARVVPDDILLKTHEGAAKTMMSIIHGKTPKGMDGQINVILNNRDQTVVFVDDKGKPIMNKGKYSKNKSLVIKDFNYIRVKDAGKSIKTDKAIKTQISDWVKQNVPKTVLTKDLWPD